MFPFPTFTPLREAPRQHLHNYKPVFDAALTASSCLTVLVVFVSCLSSRTAGEVPFNHEILREANALCHRLPVLSTSKFKTDFYDVSKLCVSFRHQVQDVFIRFKLKAAASKESFGGVKTNKCLYALTLMASVWAYT